MEGVWDALAVVFASPDLQQPLLWVVHRRAAAPSMRCNSMHGIHGTSSMLAQPLSCTVGTAASATRACTGGGVGACADWTFPAGIWVGEKKPLLLLVLLALVLHLQV